MSNSTRHKSKNGEAHKYTKKWVKDSTWGDSHVNWVDINNLNVDFEKVEPRKENKGKPQLSLLFKQFPKALEAVTRCSEYGHNKYKDVDQDHLNFTRVGGGSKTYADAGLRHRIEQGVDSESGLPHAYHVCWNALAELELWIKENQK